MSYPYADIAKAIALRANQLAGGDLTAVEAAYNALTLQGVEMPTTALKNVVLATAAELAAMVGNSSNALFRGAISSNSNTIADGGDIPTQSAGGDTFIGSLEGFYDTALAPIRALTEGTLQQIDRFRTQTFWKLNPLLFAETGTKLRHTGTTVVARGCVWNTATQDGLYAAGLCPLPIELKMLHVALGLTMLPSESWFVEEAGYYQGIVTQRATLIVEGKAQLMELPQIPKKTASADPIKD
jgi:hypothetical protein